VPLGATLYSEISAAHFSLSFHTPKIVEGRAPGALCAHPTKMVQKVQAFCTLWAMTRYRNSDTIPATNAGQGTFLFLPGQSS
jgi:hypothetical protein